MCALVVFFFFFKGSGAPGDLPFSPPRRSSDLTRASRSKLARLSASAAGLGAGGGGVGGVGGVMASHNLSPRARVPQRSEEHTSELQSQSNLVCRLLLEKKKNKQRIIAS